MALGVRSVLTVLEQAGSLLSELRVGGGGARIDLAGQLKADLLGRPVVHLGIDPAGFGAAMLAPRLRASAAPTPGLERLIAGLAAAGVPMALASASTLAEIGAVTGALGLGGVLRRRVGGGSDPVQARARRVPARDPAAGGGTRRGGRDRGLGHRRRGRGRGRPGVRGVRTAVTRGHDLGPAALIVSSLEELDVAALERLVPERR